MMIDEFTSFSEWAEKLGRLAHEFIQVVHAYRYEWELEFERSLVEAWLELEHHCNQQSTEDQGYLLHLVHIANAEHLTPITLAGASYLSDDDISFLSSHALVTELPRLIAYWTAAFGYDKDRSLIDDIAETATLKEIDRAISTPHEITLQIERIRTSKYLAQVKEKMAPALPQKPSPPKDTWREGVLDLGINEHQKSIRRKGYEDNVSLTGTPFNIFKAYFDAGHEGLSREARRENWGDKSDGYTRKYRAAINKIAYVAVPTARGLFSWV